MILTVPPLALDAAPGTGVEEHAGNALRSCLAAYLATDDPHPEPKILVHLEAAAFDRPDLTPVLRAIAAFLDHQLAR
ncbi:hypothetical protein [Paractinoplanes durhamensis]|uniref:Uncharacterized protein n=1 Tax=Paractinoplanes durhamensis TaxID=113563 RepID=A0ABQ3YZ32_9ACTN|nr:hypothetical protein [Actinoplanes durhamensis]GIE02785.1 hypothetical protein Adu01nite_41350 [Actinoplanes durhamensis]